MKTILLCCLLFCSSNLFSQELAGNWKGKFVDTYMGTEYSISLQVILKPDNKYEITSLSEIEYDLGGKSIPTICAVSYNLLGDSLILQETSVIKAKSFSNPCFQKMNLKIVRNKNKLKLVGEWNTIKTQVACNGSGTVSFSKQKK